VRDSIGKRFAPTCEDRHRLIALPEIGFLGDHKNELTRGQRRVRKQLGDVVGEANQWHATVGEAVAVSKRSPVRGTTFHFVIKANPREQRKDVLRSYDQRPSVRHKGGDRHSPAWIPPGPARARKSHPYCLNRECYRSGSCRCSRGLVGAGYFPIQ
jgi:hypothetical protein